MGTLPLRQHPSYTGMTAGRQSALAVGVGGGEEQAEGGLPWPVEVVLCVSVGFLLVKVA